MRFVTLLVALPVSFAFAQDTNPVTSRTYRFTGPAPSARDYRELATVIRTVGDANEVNVDAAAGQIAFSGRGESPEMSEWLLRQLDKASGATPSEAPEFHSAQQDDHVAVFYLAHLSAPHEVAEVLTVLRTVVDAQKIFSYTRLNALVVRGPAAQMALVKKLVADLDRSLPIAAVEVLQFAVAGTPEERSSRDTGQARSHG